EFGHLATVSSTPCGALGAGICPLPGTIRAARPESANRAGRSPRSTSGQRGWKVQALAESNAELARRGYEAALRGDLDLVGGMLAPDVKWHGGDPTAEGSCQNRTQALDFMRRAIEARA